ncbi:MAG: polyprenyl synthetase family protein [Treponema sp.]|jgi:octaprenyl-diphosphate synthase|nr:polyprenyl synthetase family protein [Treponema sp.]
METQYTRRIENIEAVLVQYLNECPDPAWTARIFPGLENRISTESVAALTAPGWDLLSRGGKRWRPLLMTLVCESLGGADAALPLAPLVELPHTASLIHDDIEDNSDERRGKPAVHIIHGVDAAINGGSFLYFLPLRCINPWGDKIVKEYHVPAEVLAERKNKIYALWGEYMQKLHLGQAMDIHWHRDFSSLPCLDEYYTMCGLKTGCLARFAASLGVCAAAAVNTIPEAELGERLGNAAENLGVGFQILDDVKNLTTGIPGKKRGDDVAEGKKSLPVLMYLHRRPDKQEFVARCFAAARDRGTSAPETETLIGELAAAGILQEAAEQGLALIKKARGEFDGPDIAGLFELIS